MAVLYDRTELPSLCKSYLYENDTHMIRTCVVACFDIQLTFVKVGRQNEDTF